MIFPAAEELSDSAGELHDNYTAMRNLLELAANHLAAVIAEAEDQRDEVSDYRAEHGSYPLPEAKCMGEARQFLAQLQE
jgi:hypothetical protein